MLWPEAPEFATESERRVWELLRAGLDDDDLLIANQRVTDLTKDYEIDLAVVAPGAGVVVVEVKGGGVRHDGTSWCQWRHGKDQRIDPVGQVRSAMYALRSYLEADGRWGSRRRVRWGHAIVMPYLALADDFALPDCPRWAVVAKGDMGELVDRLRSIGEKQETHNRLVTVDDVHAIADILRGRSLPQRDLLGEAAEREDVADRLTQEQAAILNAIQLCRGSRSAAAPAAARRGWRSSRRVGSPTPGSGSRCCATRVVWQRSWPGE